MGGNGSELNPAFIQMIQGRREYQERDYLLETYHTLCSATSIQIEEKMLKYVNNDRTMSTGLVVNDKGF